MPIQPRRQGKSRHFWQLYQLVCYVVSPKYLSNWKSSPSFGENIKKKKLEVKPSIKIIVPLTCCWSRKPIQDNLTWWSVRFSRPLNWWPWDFQGKIFEATLVFYSVHSSGWWGMPTLRILLWAIHHSVPRWWVEIHPRQLTWNPTWRFGRWFSFSTGWFLDSMLIFRGVCLFSPWFGEDRNQSAKLGGPTTKRKTWKQHFYIAWFPQYW